MLGRIFDHDFSRICILFTVCLFINASGADGALSQSSPTLCVEPSTPTISPTTPPLNVTPNPPFNEGPNPPFVGSPVINPPYQKPPFNESPEPPCNEMPIVHPPFNDPDPPPFNEMPIVHPPFNDPDPPPFNEMPIVHPPFNDPDPPPFNEMPIAHPPFNENPNPPCKGGNPINVKLENVSPEGDFGIKFSYDTDIDKRMNVMISYDTETTSAATFFKEQFTNSLFQRFTLCGVVQWDIMPCFRSKMKGGQLWCPEGDKQCEFNKIHACVATIYKTNQLKVGSFVICFFTQGNNTQQCAANNGLNYDEIWECASASQGANDCDECYRHVHGKPSQKDTSVIGAPTNPGFSQPVYGGGFDTPEISNPGGDVILHTTDSSTPSTPSVANQPTSVTPASTNNLAGNLTPSTTNSAVNQVPIGVYSPDVNVSPDSNLNAITDFKSAVCAKLDEGKLQCDYCSA